MFVGSSPSENHNGIRTMCFFKRSASLCCYFNNSMAEMWSTLRLKKEGKNESTRVSYRGANRNPLGDAPVVASLPSLRMPEIKSNLTILITSYLL